MLDTGNGFCDNSRKGEMMAKRKSKSPITDVLRQAILDSGLAYIELERQTGVMRDSISRFVRGQQSLRLDMADKLVAYFGIQIRRKGK